MQRKLWRRKNHLWNSVNEEDFTNIDMGSFEEKYSEKGLWEKIQSNVAAIGEGLIYKELQLFYVAQSPHAVLGEGESGDLRGAGVSHFAARSHPGFYAVCGIWR